MKLPAQPPAHQHMPSPMFQYSAMSVQPGDEYFIEPDPAISLTGQSPFSITGWIRVPTASPLVNSNVVMTGAAILSKGRALGIVVTGGCLAVTSDGYELVVASEPLPVGSWHSFAVTFSPTYSGTAASGLLTLYVDGAVQAQKSEWFPSGPSPEDVGWTVGGNSTGYASDSAGANFDLLYLAFWNSAEDSLDGQWQPPAPGPSLLACLDFSAGAVQDISGNGFTGNFLPPVWYTPGLLLENGAAMPSPLDALNPGGEPGAAYTISAWVNAQAPVPDMVSTTLTLLSNGPFAVALLYNEETSSFTLSASLGVTPVLSQTSFNPNEWHHVAITCDGSTVSLYIDGVPSGSGDFVTEVPMGTPAVLIGAQSSTSNTGPQSLFKGTVQALALYNTALTSVEVATYMTTPPVGVAGLTAFYDFMTADVFNLATGNPIAFLNNVHLGETNMLSSGVPSTNLRVVPSARSLGPVQELEEMAKDLKVDTSVRPESKLASASQIDGYVADFENLLRRLRIPEQMRLLLAAKGRKNLYAGFHLQNQLGTGFLPGAITVERQGAEYVYYHYTRKGREEVMRDSINQYDACTAWYISVGCSALTLLLSVMGVAITASILGVAVRAAMTGSTTLLAGMRVVVANYQSTTLVVKIAQTFFTSGTLSTIISTSIAGTNWWNFALTVLSVIAQIISLWLSGGLFLAYIVAKLLIGIVSLVSVIAQKPNDC